MPETVESGISSAIAICHPVRRTRRSAAIAWRRSSGTRVGLTDGHRGAVPDACKTLRPEPGQPLRGRAIADTSGFCCPTDRPSASNHSIDQQLTALDAEPSVSVQLHPVSSLGLVGFDTTSLQGGPDEQRPQELQLATRAAWARPHTGAGLLLGVAEQRHDRQREDLQVEADRPVSDVVVVPLDTLGEGGLAT
jgi:hypothetical protein